MKYSLILFPGKTYIQIHLVLFILLLLALVFQTRKYFFILEAIEIIIYVCEFYRLSHLLSQQLINSIYTVGTQMQIYLANFCFLNLLPNIPSTSLHLSWQMYEKYS